MSELIPGPELAPIPAGAAAGLLAMAARAPSILNTQPWRFLVCGRAIELHADPSRRLRCDLSGREMLISCGAALFGLRLAVRALGHDPVVQVLPDAGRTTLLARVGLGAPAPLSDLERRLIEALPHRHTHRGPFGAGTLPDGLLTSLRQDAAAESAVLALIEGKAAYDGLAAIVAEGTRQQAADPRARADIRQWVRLPGSASREGVPASAIVARAAGRSGPPPGSLAQRDFDLGRDIGSLPSAQSPVAATAVLLTATDTPADWINAGQALHRLLARAASQWIFASLHSAPLEVARTRALIRSSLRLPGAPQMLLQFGVARATQATPRRPAAAAGCD
ncbi:MAG TPA: hypothetical protein VNF47_22970 [Streptosporangiaceae bacterium]|nr:hypothetical protein [Streptosporangiaceae bacterium]